MAAPKGPCERCPQEGFEEPRCSYCGAWLSSRHEHDHMPKPARHGGDEQIPVCLNCHDLKDRLDVRNWTAASFFEAFHGLNPMGRILLARVVALYYDLQAEKEGLRS